MASTPRPQFDEEDEGGPQAPGAPGAPTVAAPSIGGTASLGGTVSGNSAAAPKSQVQGATAGTGFVNIDKYLGANQGAGADLERRAREVRTREGSAFDTASGAFKTAVDKEAPGQIDVKEIVDKVVGPAASSTPTIGNPGQPVTTSGPRTLGAVGSGVGASTAPQAPQPNMVWQPWSEGGGDQDSGRGSFVTAGPTPFVADQGAISTASGILQDTYDGPTTLDYDVGGTEDAGLLKGLQNGQTAGRTLAGMSGPLANYSTGLNAIDNFIYGNATGSTAAIEGANKAEFDRQGGEKKKAESHASDVKGLVQSNADNLRSALQDRGENILSSATGKATSAGALQQGKKEMDDRPGWTWQGGGDPTASQFMSDSDISGLNNIGRLLGGKTDYAKGPKFTPGNYQIDPIKEPLTKKQEQENYDKDVKGQYRDTLLRSGMDEDTANKVAEMTSVDRILQALSQNRTALAPNAPTESDWVQG